MSEPIEPGAGAQGLSAGAMLREARQAQGMHIAALAAAIKVAPRKLEALEADRYDELPDTTFTRALAQAVCRALKIDAEPVLAKLPQAPGKGLEQVSGGLNAPFRERGIRRDAGDWPGLGRPVVWGSLALLVAAAAVFLLPPGLFSSLSGGAAGSASAPGAGDIAPVTTPAPVAPPSPAPTPAASEPVPAPAASGPAGPAPATSLPQAPGLASAPVSEPAGAPASAPPTVQASSATGLTVQADGGPSWIEVQDATGKVLISRTVAAGESVSLEGPVPLRVKIGNVAVTRLSFRGQPVSLPTKDNVARLELK